MASSSRFLHPSSGAFILGLDWVLFSGNVLSLGVSTPVLTLSGFVLGTLGTGILQSRYGGDGRWMSVGKGLLGGIAVGIPLPIVGTAVGGAILALSGLNREALLGRDDSESPSDDPEKK
ncbi:MAG: phosphoribosylaminoimidazole carboxylase [Salinivenus sp.]